MIKMKKLKIIGNLSQVFLYMIIFPSLKVSITPH